MTHYSSQQWIDFARSLASPQDTEAMTSHLKSGCESCAKEKAVWSKLAGFAKTETEFEPPAHIVNAAKALMQAPKREKAGLRIREIAHLVFDSFSDASAGWSPFGGRGRIKAALVSCRRSNDRCALRG